MGCRSRFRHRALAMFTAASNSRAACFANRPSCPLHVPGEFDARNATRLCSPALDLAGASRQMRSMRLLLRNVCDAAYAATAALGRAEPQPARLVRCRSSRRAAGPLVFTRRSDAADGALCPAGRRSSAAVPSVVLRSVSAPNVLCLSRERPSDASGRAARRLPRLRKNLRGSELQPA